FLLGLSLAIISALGVLMWIDRRRNGGKKYKSLHHILTGVTAGAPLTYGAIFILDKIYLGAEASRLAWTGVLFFTIWLAAIVYVFIRKNDRAAFRETFIASAVVLMAVPLVNGGVTGDWVWNAFTAPHAMPAFVDSLFLLLALAIFICAKRIR
ncbi:MAG: hypothetical protein PVF65_11940, partial [Sphingomonadales bacterium]